MPGDLERESNRLIAGKKAIDQWVEEPKSPEPLPATPEELQQLYELVSTVDLPRAEFLYRQRWEACELKPTRLPLQSDTQYLGTNWKVLDDMRKKQEM